ncbi:MAG: ribonuclease P protein component [Crocinitomicaceae bacterium]|nr:ribonuclease P protein component [Crocinitomicaceae bacterium]
MALTFGKNEKLVSRKRIDTLFQGGKVLKKFPLLLKYNSTSDNPGVRIAVSVPKRKVKSAAKRNRIKRQIREAYRLNKSSLLETAAKKELDLALFLIYNGEEKTDFKKIQEKLVLILRELEEKL